MRVCVQYAEKADTEDIDNLLIVERARREWEAKNGQSLRSAEQSGYSAYVADLTHATLVHRHGETRSFDDWLDVVDEINLLPEDPKQFLPLFNAMSPAQLEAVALYTQRRLKRDVAYVPVDITDGPPPAEDPTGGESTPTPDGSPA